MIVTVLTEEEWLKLDESNDLRIQDQKEENFFQVEVRKLYHRLVETLSDFGQEGDYYGVSDFAVRPDLRNRAKVKAPPAAPIREFHVTLLSQQFHQSDYLHALQGFLKSEANTYRVVVAKDFDPTWILRISLSTNLAQIYCTSPKELSRLESILTRL
jgi:hypothetical protein